MIFKWLSVFLNISLIVWISYESFRHFNRGEKEPFGMVAIRVLTPLAVLWNLFVVFSGDRSGLTVSIFLLITLFSATIFYLAIKETKGVYLPVAYSYNSKTHYVSSGIYSFIRHPFYLSYILYWMSWGIVNIGSMASLVFTSILVITYVLAVNTEEKFLKIHYKSDHARHVKNSYRLVPFIY